MTKLAIGLFCTCGHELVVERPTAAPEFKVHCSAESCPEGIVERGANAWIAIEFWLHEQRVRAALPNYVAREAEGVSARCRFCFQHNCNDIESMCPGPEVRRRAARVEAAAQ
jgi:hypothetical protein